jgi:multidrug efflux pump subunit AcrB
MGGIIGKFFYQFGVAVTVAVLVSLFVSFTLDPMLSAVWRDKPSRINEFGPVRWLISRQDRFMDWLHNRYDLVLRWALKPDYRKIWVPKLTLIQWMRNGFSRSHLRVQRATIRNRGIVLWMAAGIFFGSFLLVPFIGSEFVPETDENWANVSIQTPIGSSLSYTLGKADQVEAALREFPEVKRVTRNVWKNGAWFGITLTDKETRERSKNKLDDAFRKRLASIAGLEVRVGWNRNSVFIMGPDIRELDRLSKEVIAKVKTVKGAVDVESSYKPTSPTLDITINRQLASDLGVSMQSVVLATRAAEEVYGKPSSLIPTAGGSSPIYAFSRPLNIPVITAGIGNMQNRQHAPDEFVRIADFVNGTRHVARIMDGFAGL